MKPLRISFFVMMLTLFAAAGTSTTVFQGEISDSQCAMNVHSLSRSHEEMIAKKTLGTDAASCAKACVRRGGEWVLRSGDKVYRLKNQAGVEQFAGRKVRVFGSLESKGESIDNALIEDRSN